MEKWKDIRGFEGKYAVSDHGRVKHLPDGHILKPRIHTHGYLRVNLKKKDYYIHRLVANAFLFDVKPEVNHIDLNKTNNNVSNLEWCTRGENIAHGYKMGSRTNPGAGKFGDLNVNSIAVIATKGNYIIKAGSIAELGRILKRSQSTASEAFREGHRCAGYTIKAA